MAHLHDYFLMNGKSLVMEFIFEKVQNHSENALMVCSLDKYLSVSDWQSIYDILMPQIDKYIKYPNQSMEKQTFTISRSQLQLKTTWKSLHHYHTNILGLKQKRTHAKILSTEIKTFSKVNEFQNMKKSNENNNNESEPSNKSIAVSDDSTEEYIPSPRQKNIPTNVKYTPNVKTKRNELEEYVPDVIVKLDSLENVLRSPLKRSQSPASTASTATGEGSKAPSRERNKKANVSQSLFTDSDDSPSYEPPKDIIPVTPMKRSRRAQTQCKSMHVKTEPFKQKTRSVTAPHGKIEKKRPKDNEIHLKNLTNKELLNGLDKFIDQHENLFTEYHKGTERRARRPKDYNFQTLLENIITQQQQHFLMDEFSKKFSLDNEMIPTRQDMYIWELLIPEYIVVILCEEFNITRQEAINEINRIDQLEIENCDISAIMGQ